jgi:DNA repair exonuclease SbcCD nuclease subunit
VVTYTDQSIMLIGDLHFRDTPPRNATDTYVDDLFDLLDWTIDYAVDNKIRTIVWAGDIFDHKQPSRTSHALVLRLVSRVKEIIAAGIELIIVVGNHDISNDVVESAFTKQPLALLYAAGAKALDGWHDTLPLYGIPWQQRWHAPGVLDTVFERYRTALGRDETDTPGVSSMEESPEQTLVVTHASIFPDDLHRDIMYEAFSASEVAEAMSGAGNLYHGHIHDDHGVYEAGGVQFCNPGALSRGSASESNITRTIHLAVWTPPRTYDADGWTDGGFDIVDIPIAKSAEETFRLESVREHQSNQKTLERFLAGLGSTVLDITDRHAVVRHIRERQDISPRVRERAIEMLEAQDA